VWVFWAGHPVHSEELATPPPQVQVSSSVTSVSTEPHHIDLISVNNEAFQVGEELIFDLNYEFITAGQASLKVENGLQVNGRPTISFVSSAKTSDFFDVFFKVRDYNASQVDEPSLMAVNFHQNLREGDYRVIRNTSFDYPNGIFKFEKLRKGNLTQRSGVIDRPVLDILSSFYFTRVLPLEPGKEYFMDVFSDEDVVYPLKVVVDKKIEKIKVPAGNFHCLQVTPYVVGDAIFKARGGKMSIWLTNDARHMPVLLSSKVFIGSFDAKLVSYKAPNK